MVTSQVAEIYYTGNASTVTGYAVSPIQYLDPETLYIGVTAPGNGTVSVNDGVATFTTAQDMTTGDRIRIGANDYVIFEKLSGISYKLATETDLTTSSFYILDDEEVLTGSDRTLVEVGAGAPYFTTATAYANTNLVRVFRYVPYTQLTELDSSGPLPPERVEEALDHQTFLSQQLVTLIGNLSLVVGGSGGGGPVIIAGDGIDITAGEVSVDSTVVRLTGAQALTSKSVNGVTLSTSAGSALFLAGDGVYKATGIVSAYSTFYTADLVIVSANDSRGVKDSDIQIFSGLFLEPVTDRLGALGRLSNRWLSIHTSQFNAGGATTTSSRDVVDTDFAICVDATGGNRVITLPPADTCGGRVLGVYRTSSGGNTVTIDRNGFDIDGAATDLVISTQNAGYLLESFGSNGWKIVAQYFPGSGVYTAGTGLQLSGNTFAINSSVATLTGSQALTNKSVNGVTLATTWGTGVFLRGDGTYAVAGTTYSPGSGIQISGTTISVDNASVARLTTAQALTNKSVNGVTLTAAGSASDFLNAAGNYVAPASVTYTAGTGLQLSGSTFSINSSVVTLTGAQALTNKTYNGVTLTNSGSATDFLNAAGNYVSTAYLAGTGLQLSGSTFSIDASVTTASNVQALINKSINGVVPSTGAGSTNFLNGAGGYTVPAGTVYTGAGGVSVVGTLISLDASIAVTRTGAQTVTNKTISASTYNGVSLTTAGSATDALDGTGAYSEFVKPDGANQITGYSYVAPHSTLTDAASINWDVVASPSADVTLTASGHTVTPVTTPVQGVDYILRIKNGSVAPYTVLWDAQIKWPGGVAPTLTALVNAVDIFSFKSGDSFMYGSVVGQNYL